MEEVRKLQFIGNQFALNMPRALIQFWQWEKGDYLSITHDSTGHMTIRKIAGKNADRKNVMRSSTEMEVVSTFDQLYRNVGIMDAASFCGLLAQLSHSFSRLRKYRMMEHVATAR